MNFRRVAKRFVAPTIATYLAFEMTIYLASVFGLVSLASIKELRGISHQDAGLGGIRTWPSIYVPHPYFGFLPNPRTTYSQTNPANGNVFSLTANSDGFIDSEFPKAKEKNVFVIALIGGSGAMSWGVENPADWISAQLEKLLNTTAAERSLPRRFRVLNMGLPSYIQYQATQTFIYYRQLLDGVIVYAGHNELSQPIILQTAKPIRYPWVDPISNVVIESPNRYDAYERRRDLTRTAQRCLRLGPLLRLPSLRLICEFRIRRATQTADAASRRLTDDVGGSRAVLPAPDDPLRVGLPPYQYQDFFFNKRPELQAYRHALLSVVLPAVYTDPIDDAAAVARAHGIKILNVIQPLLGAVDKKLTPNEVSIVNVPVVRQMGEDYDAVQYERGGIAELRHETARLKDLGVVTIDLNDMHAFPDSVDAFMDPAHLTPAGTTAVAKALEQSILREWPEIMKPET